MMNVGSTDARPDIYVETVTDDSSVKDDGFEEVDDGLVNAWSSKWL